MGVSLDESSPYGFRLEPISPHDMHLAQSMCGPCQRLPIVIQSDPQLPVIQDPLKALNRC